MNIPILYEDDYLLVIDKPPGIVVNNAESVKVETIQDWMTVRYPLFSAHIQTDTASDFYKRAGIVHRIDKETSGILLLAKSEEVFFALQAQFKERTITKTYTTLVHGVSPKDGTINVPIARLPWSREQFGIIPGGREAVTSFKTIQYLKSSKDVKYSLVEAFPKTGRTHQIRVHMKYLGYTLVSDSVYAGRKLYRDDIELSPRLFLHASTIVFTHPILKNILTVSSPLPTDLSDALKKLSIV